MTSYSPPDYFINLSLTAEHLQVLGGSAFDVRIHRPKTPKTRTIGAMLLIPDMSTHFTGGTIMATLWIDSAQAIVPLDTPLTFELVDLVNPMLTLEELEEVTFDKSIRFSGIIDSNA